LPNIDDEIEIRNSSEDEDTTENNYVPRALPLQITEQSSLLPSSANILRAGTLLI